MTRQLPREHGSSRGYTQHRDAKEIACDACLRAWRQYAKRSWQRSRCAPGLGWPLLDPPVQVTR